MNERAEELDSLRGISIILVIAFHVFKRAAYFTKNEILHFISSLTYIGWMGVDVFFVLSGFLITSILLKTKNGSHYFKNFYARRILRIFPLYYIFIVVMLILLPIFLPDYKSNIPMIAPYLFLYIQNWIMRQGGSGLPAHLGATWSLAIEEQFYLIWPMIVYYTRRDTLIKIGMGVILFSLFYRMLAALLWSDVGQFATFFYFDTFTRFSELIFGALLAAFFTDEAWRERIRLFSPSVFLISFLMFVGMCFYLYPNLIPYYSSVPLTLWAYILIPLFSASLIGLLVTSPENNLIRKFFRNKIFSFFGKYSYSMYLLHMPIALALLDFMDGRHLKGWKVYFGYIVLTYILTTLGSLATWHILEKRMLRLKKYFEY
jgi:peptidoglycan/LPS O-acetylase OafA/YrhL